MPGVDINRYAYAGNDPVNGSDANGHNVRDAHDLESDRHGLGGGGKNGSSGSAAGHGGNATNRTREECRECRTVADESNSIGSSDDDDLEGVEPKLPHILGGLTTDTPSAISRIERMLSVGGSALPLRRLQH